ncbi:MAG TPA: dihydrofolate reductase family protein [Steroidobacteraceae bacterium]|nr:dihydrofolate reductase family protein [Steroidobacteraceae bacterium]
MNEPGMDRLHTLLDHTATDSPSVLTPELHALYDGDLSWVDSAGDETVGAIPPPRNRPHVIANFVASLDGVVSYKLPGRAGGATISGGDQVDHFVMGLLRASSDAVMVGAGTLHDTVPGTLWTADYICPQAMPLYTSYRRALGRGMHPLAVIVSASGMLDLSRAVFRTPGIRALVVTTGTGRKRLAEAGIESLADVELQVAEAVAGRIDPHVMLEGLWERGVRVLLNEGGPSLFGDFLAAGVVDELFLTLASQAVGRADETRRPGLVQGIEFSPEGAPWFSLISVKQQREQLYLRYRCTGPRGAVPVPARRDRSTRDPSLA